MRNSLATPLKNRQLPTHLHADIQNLLMQQTPKEDTPNPTETPETPTKEAQQPHEKRAKISPWHGIL